MDKASHQHRSGGPAGCVRASFTQADLLPGNHRQVLENRQGSRELDEGGGVPESWSTSATQTLDIVELLPAFLDITEEV